jgi:amino acid transporter
MSTATPLRSLSLIGATGVGVGAIVGGGVLALAGVAFATTGPGAILAFALNGLVALLTVFSFSELASRFPESGGTYTYARRVLTVEAAFGIGWVVWFASVVAAVLYALGFAVFLVPVLELGLGLAGLPTPAWLDSRFGHVVSALLAVGLYSLALMRSSSGGGQWATVGKLVVFGIVIGGGLWAVLTGLPAGEPMSARFRPFFSEGATGLLQAMGYTFIALQGFDLVAAVGGEVRNPTRNIPRAMFLSLGTALLVYIPLLTLVVAVGTPGESVAEAARRSPEVLIAVAAGNFIGPSGYWLVIVAGILSMLSALQANLLAASRFARSMAADRTLPRALAAVSPSTGAPRTAVWVTSGMVAILLLAVPDVAAAGAMSGLIFLFSFTLVHGISYLARIRSEDPSPFLSPVFPLVPLVGGVACLSLGLFQAVAVPAAGALAALWIATGAILYVTRIGSSARVVDASSEARDPELLRLRGRTPRILVPIANPASAEALVEVAHALAPAGVARVLLLSVLDPRTAAEAEGGGGGLADVQAVLGGALSTAIARGLRPEVLVTVHDDPWSEIARVAEQYRCERVLLGFGRLEQADMTGPLERLIARVSGDVVVLRAPAGWRLDGVERILVPSGGARHQSSIRARLLGSLCRAGERRVTFLQVLQDDPDPRRLARARERLILLANDEAPGVGDAHVVASPDLFGEVGRLGEEADLVVLGLHRGSRSNRLFGEVVLGLVRVVPGPMLMISQRD